MNKYSYVNLTCLAGFTQLKFRGKMKNKTWVYTLLGLLLLVAGVTKLFVTGHDGVTGMLSGNFLFSWAPGFWAWVLIFGEIIFGLGILSALFMKANKNWVKYSGWGGALIMFVIVITMQIKWSDLGSISWNSLITHLILAFSYLLLAEGYFDKKN